MSGFTLQEMMLQGWPVLSVLLVMSILSVTVLVDRLWTLRRARLDARLFVENVIRTIDERGVARTLESCRSYRQPVAVVAAAILKETGDREARERALQHTLQGQIRDLETFIPILGTIGSTAPFVGLFGTVAGIIRAFQSIALNSGGGPEVVASGIAEALITTAFGLLVAIPAVIGYNYCVRRVQRLTEEIDYAAFELIEKLTRTP